MYPQDQRPNLSTSIPHGIWTCSAEACAFKGNMNNAVSKGNINPICIKGHNCLSTTFLAVCIQRVDELIWSTSYMSAEAITGFSQVHRQLLLFLLPLVLSAVTVQIWKSQNSFPQVKKKIKSYKLILWIPYHVAISKCESKITPDEKRRI